MCHSQIECNSAAPLCLNKQKRRREERSSRRLCLTWCSIRLDLQDVKRCIANLVSVSNHFNTTNSNLCNLDIGGTQTDVLGQYLYTINVENREGSLFHILHHYGGLHNFGDSLTNLNLCYSSTILMLNPCCSTLTLYFNS